MSLLRDILRQYWVNLLAIGVFVCAAVRYCCLNDAFAVNSHLEWLVVAFVGMVMFVGSEVWSEWADHFDIDRWKWIPTPPWFIRLVGGTVLVYFTIALFCV